MSAVAISVVAAACSGEPVGGGLTPPVDPTGGGNAGSVTAERAFFDEHVLPIMVNTCANCHSNAGDQYGAPEFLGLAQDQYYDALSKNTSFVGCDIENSILLLKGLDPAHVGGPLTLEQHEKVETWLTLEAIARFNGTCGGPPTTTATTSTAATTGAGGGGTGGEGGAAPVGPMTGQQAMEEFGKCMSLSDWIDSGMPLIANQQCEYQNNTLQCYNCHNNFATGSTALPNPNAANATEEIERAFEQMRHMYSSFALVRWNVNPEDGSFKELVSSYRLRDKGMALNHPTFELSAERVGYYEDFMARTMAKYEAGPCVEEPPPAP
jgi:cytochrome c553